MKKYLNSAIIDCWIWDVLWCFSGGFVLSQYTAMPILRLSAAILYIISTLVCMLQVVKQARRTNQCWLKSLAALILIVLLVDIIYSIYVIIIVLQH